jgi:hypothetical protein
MAKHGKVSWGFPSQVITELKALGAVVDPKVLRQKKDKFVGQCRWTWSKTLDHP